MPRYYSKTPTGRASRLEGPLNLGRGFHGGEPAVKVYLEKRVMAFTKEEVVAMLAFFDRPPMDPAVLIVSRPYEPK